jgi:hypothetical protein
MSPKPILSTYANNHLNSVNLHKGKTFLPLHKKKRKEKRKLTDKERRAVCTEAASNPTLTHSQIASMPPLSTMQERLLTISR